MLLKYVVGIIEICCWKIKVVSMLLLCMIICYWFAPNPNITILCYYVYLNLRFNGYKIILLTFCTSIKNLTIMYIYAELRKTCGLLDCLFCRSVVLHFTIVTSTRPKCPKTSSTIFTKITMD